MSSQLQVTGEAKIRDIQGPVVANSGVITALDGAASQYVRGDGTLADFPTSSGGGSSVSYYLNTSVSQGTIGGVDYKELNKEPIIGAGTDIAISTTGYVASYLTDANDPDVLSIPGGNFNCEFYFSVNNNTGNPFFYAELYKYDGSTFTLLGSSVGVPEYINQGTIIAPYYFAIPVATAALALTDRLAIRIYVNVDGRTVTLHTENGHLCQVVTTLSKGMTSLNNLTDQSQYLTTGTSGTNFNIVSSGDTHTFNLPIASATNTGKLSSTDWSTFNNKQNALTDPITGIGNSTQIAYFNSPTSITSEAAFNYDASTNRLGVNTSVPNATIGANAGTDSGYSLLLKNDNANYNGIGFGTDSTYGNLISTEKLGTALARNLTLLNQSGYISITEVGNLGVNILSPNTGLDIYNGTSAFLWLHTANSGITGTDGVRLALFSTNAANLRNYEGAFSITAEGDFSIITIGAENFRINSADGSIYQSKVANAMLKSVSGVITAAVANTDYQSPISLTTSGSSGAATFISNTLNVPNYTLSGLGGVPTSRTLSINGVSYDLSADRSWTITSDITGSGADGRVAYWNGTNSITSEAGFIYDASTNRLGVNTSVPNATIGANASTDSGYSLLLKNADSNYSGIGFSTSSVYGNSIETVRLGSAPSRNLTLYNYGGYISITENGSLGVNILTPNNGIDIYNSTQSQLWLHNNASGLTSTDGVRLALFNNLSANLRNFDGALSLTAEGDFSIITIGTENFKVNSANGYVAIGGPATITSMLTVNGAITQSSVTSALLKTDASGTLVAAVAGTDYVIPSALSSYVPTSRTLTINGTSYDLSANRSWTISSGVSGTTDYIPRFTSSTTIGNSDISQDATFVTLNSRALSAPRARFNTAYDNASLIINAAGQVYIDSRTSRLYQTFNLSSISNYMHIYDPYSTVNANGGFSIGSSSSITLLPSTSIIHFDGVNNRVGIGTTSPSFILSLGGDSARTIGMNQSTLGTAPSLTLKSADSTTGTNNEGGALYLSAGLGTGAGATSNIVFSTGAPLGSGSTRQTLTERMRITSDGDILIRGTYNPFALANRGNITLNGTNSNILAFTNGSDAKGYIFHNQTDMEVINRATGNLSFATSNTERMRITSGGDVLIGTTSSPSTYGKVTIRGTNAGLTIQDASTNAYRAIYNQSNTLYFWNGSNEGYLSSAGAWVNASDISIKKDVKDLEYGLKEVLNLKPKSYKMIHNDLAQIGFIAQEVGKILPELVDESKKGMKGLSYGQMTAVLVKAIQELTQKVNELESKIK